VGVCQQLVTPATRVAYMQRAKLENATRREQHAGRSTKAPQLSLAAARADRTVLDWASYVPPVPRMLGVRAFDNWSIEELSRYIDWTPFFQAWELHGRFPDILTDKVVGVQASKLYDDARQMLRSIIREQWLRARAVFGLFAANSRDDDVLVYADESRSAPVQVLNFMRQQKDLPKGMPHASLADYFAPTGSGVRDYIGAFAVTSGVGIESHLARFAAAHDDYSSIMLKVLADRLAEALAERLHERVRREFWGYASDEKLSNEQLIREEYRGIRPAPGYPSCPDHTEKSKLFALLQVEQNAGITLTESFAMYPTAAVSGWYFAHPQARYINLGKINRDQVEDYAHRKGMTLAVAERWLAPNLGYEPAVSTA
jgi:5-methyltetrahydrofolate--homocysteine methyltransferase